MMTDYHGDYHGTCNITRMVWNIEDTMTWEEMRGVILRGEETERGKPVGERGAEAVGRLLDGRYPVFDCGNGYGPFVKGWTRDWDAFILSWAEAQAALRDADRAGDEEEMAAMLEELGDWYQVQGETVDAFNERLWRTEVEDMMDCLSEDFEALAERLDVARTMHLAQGGETAA